MKTLSVPPEPGGGPLHDWTGSFGKRSNPSVMRGSELWYSGFGPAAGGMYVGRGPPAGAVAPGGAAAGADGVLGGLHASSSSASPVPPAMAPVVLRRRKARRLRSIGPPRCSRPARL